MNIFSSAPFIRVLPAFIAGVVLSFQNIGSKSFFISLLVAVLIIFQIWIRTQYKNQYKFRFINPVLLLTGFFCVGWILNSLKSDSCSVKNDFKAESKYVIGKIISIPVLAGKMQRAEIMITAYCDSLEWFPANFKAYFYYYDSISPEVNVGDLILMPNKIKEIEEPLNPGQFNFKKYAAIKRISYQCRLTKSDWKILSKNHSFSLLNSSKSLRDQLLSSFHKAGIYGQEYAVLSALVLGYDDEINKEIMAAFSASGTLHILSVSGMHVGIVFAALAFLFRKMENKKVWWLVRLISMVLIIWFYAILTGMSPSVIRSAMMFTFILIGKSINRNSNIYNTLAASILVICVAFDPLILFEPGFQLSYFAVAGIAFIYPSINHWFYIRNKFLSSIWSLIAVSIAAQLATFPISLYYFHQFPNYFIPANLLIIPVSTIAIFGGLALFFIAPFEWLLVKLGFCLNKIIQFLNFLAIEIKDLPFAVTEDLYLSFAEMVLLDLIILFMIFYFYEKSIQKLRISLLFFMLFLISKTITSIENSKRQEIIEYKSFKEPVYEIINGQSTALYFYPGDSLRARKFSDEMHAYYKLNRKNRIEFDLSDSSNLVFDKYLVSGKTSMLVNSNYKKKTKYPKAVKFP
ncbi:MAG: ComEC/Rec2 family competence protein [Bacteroidetes bacterium]|nr:ComEC/Rec2 family competence protein [Bacteroidota bacterium]